MEKSVVDGVWLIQFIISLLLIDLSESARMLSPSETKCKHLLPGQYYCPTLQIDIATQQIEGCMKNRTARIFCSTVEGISCNGLHENNRTFDKYISCKWTNGKNWRTAMILSVFLGFLGIDRIYLGYYALGLAKFATCGGLCFWYAIDIVQIALQQLKPSDGSAYIIDYYGPRMSYIALNNGTFVKPYSDVFP